LQGIEHFPDRLYGERSIRAHKLLSMQFGLSCFGLQLPACWASQKLPSQVWLGACLFYI
jgi:hypothetical protein